MANPLKWWVYAQIIVFNNSKSEQFIIFFYCLISSDSENFYEYENLSIRLNLLYIFQIKRFDF